MSNKIFITGGNGFLGTALTSQLLKEGRDDFQYSFRSTPLLFAADKGVKLDLNDITTLKDHESQLSDSECLIHAAAVISHTPADNLVGNMREQVIDNIATFTNLVETMPNLKKIIYISSGSAQIADEDPTFYGMGKLTMEQAVGHYCKLKGIVHISLRFPQLYGVGEPHNTFITKFIDSIKHDREITLVNNGETVRDILYVKDAAGSIIHGLDHEESGLYTISDPETHTVKEILNYIIQIGNPKFTAINQITVPDDQVAKSFKLSTDVDRYGYKLRYNLTDGLTETIREWEGSTNVSQ